MKHAVLCWLKRALIGLGIVLLAALCTAAASAAMLYASLRAAPGEWSQAVRLGPWRVNLSVPAVLRLATHPIGLRALAGRTFHTSHGTLRFQPGADESSIRVVCEPCTPHAAVLGQLPLHVQRTDRDQRENDERLADKARVKLADLGAASSLTDPAALERKRAVIEAAMKRARERTLP